MAASAWSRAVPRLSLRSVVLALLGFALIVLGLLLDAQVDGPLELWGEALAAAGGFCLALAITPRMRD